MAGTALVRNHSGDRFQLHQLSNIEFLVNRVEQRLKEAHVIIPRGSRYDLYSRALRKYMTVKPVGAYGNRIRELIYYYTQLEQLARIIDALSVPPETDNWRSKILQAIGGNAIPLQRPAPTLARDIQFELRIAALCKAAGYYPRLEEPDIIVHDQHGDWSIAAKRPRSWNRLGRLVHNAGTQVKRSGTQGVIALDISLLINSEARFCIVSSQEEHRVSLESVVDTFLSSNILAMRHSVNAQNVFGVLVFAQNISFFASERSGGYCEVIRGSNLCHQDDSRHLRLKALLKGMATSTDVSSLD